MSAWWASPRFSLLFLLLARLFFGHLLTHHLCCCVQTRWPWWWWSNNSQLNQHQLYTVVANERINKPTVAIIVCLVVVAVLHKNITQEYYTKYAKDNEFTSSHTNTASCFMREIIFRQLLFVQSSNMNVVHWDKQTVREREREKFNLLRTQEGSWEAMKKMQRKKKPNSFRYQN